MTNNQVDDLIQNHRKTKLQELLLGEEFTTATGKVNFVNGEAAIYNINFALLRMHDLHLRSIEHKPVIQLRDDINKYHAASLYRMAATALTAQILTYPLTFAINCLNNLNDLVSKLNNTGGFEPILLSALSAINDSNAIGSKTLKTFNEIGWPEILGGGHETSLFVNRNANSFVAYNLEDIRSLINTREISLPSTLMERLSARSSQYMAGIEVHGCYGLVALAVGGVGLAATAATSGLGVPTITFGAAVAGGIGMVKCDAYFDKVDKPDNTPKPPKPEEMNKKPNGCVANPLLGDFSLKDPYASNALKAENISLMYGSGVNALVSKNSRGQFAFSSLPQLGMDRSGKVFLKERGLFNFTSNFNNEMIKDEIVMFNEIVERESSTRIDEFKKDGLQETPLNTKSNPDGTNPILPAPILSKIPDEYLQREIGNGFSAETKIEYISVKDSLGDSTIHKVHETSIILTSPGLRLMFGGKTTLTGNEAIDFLRNAKLYSEIGTRIESVTNIKEG